ncbi:MAG: hypothetical protein H6835_21120 [Planctomycetes bacterium]|nr:hypothetical protein [Planctomycetota bacterium]
MRALLLIGTLTALSTAQAPPFFVEVVDQATGRGVPLVELTTVHDVTFVTDSAGIAAIDEPELEGREVWLHVHSHGHAVPADGFGNRGLRVQVARGTSKRFAIERVNVAERLYRVTGAGIYRDSVLVGREVPLAQPLCAGGVFGQDSVQNARYAGRLFWFWGDTDRAGYPLGNFATSGATSRLPGDGGLDPSRGVDLDYFVGDDGFSRPMCPLDGPGPVWIDGLCVVADDDGREVMLCHYARMKDLGTMHEHGLARWNDATQRFDKVMALPLDELHHPLGHATRCELDGQDWLCFCHPFPQLRVRPRLADVLDVTRYEPLPAREPTALRCVETGEKVEPHGGSLAWNAYRNKWIAIVLQKFGRSALGEVWYCEADSPLGPWRDARRIVTHDDYSFYNVTQHVEFDQDGGRLIYFEGTYTKTFSGNPVATPRYDYNQVMDRLDLDDERLRFGDGDNHR